MAGTLQLNKHLSRFDGDIKLKGPVGWRILRPLVRAVIRALQIKISIDGGSIQHIDGERGFHIKIDSQAESYPWTIRAGSATNTRIIEPGTFGGVMPLISNVRLDHTPPPELVVNTAAVTYIYLRVHAEFTIINDFVAAAEIPYGNVTIIASSAEDPETIDSPHGGIFHILLATLDASGAVTLQSYRSSLDWTFSDTGTGESNIQLTVFT